VRSAKPDLYNEPPTVRGQVARIAGCVLISLLSWNEIVGKQWDHHQPLFWLDLITGLLALGLTFRRRRWPFQVALLLAVSTAWSMSASGPFALALVSLATRRNLRQSMLVGLVSVAAAEIFNAYQPTVTPNVTLNGAQSHLIDLAFLIVVTLALIFFGMYIGSRRELIWSLRERARQAETEQELRISQAQWAERERIAREMHDVLAHRISLVTMHSGAMAYRDDLEPGEMRESARLIQRTSHAAMTDLRYLLGVLRGADTGDRPQPTLADVSDLIADAVRNGMIVAFDTNFPEGVEPDEKTGRTIYRFVQEALTNARKHAPGAHVQVQVWGTPGDGVHVEVCNPRRVGQLGIAPRSGLGLVGLKERVELEGGSLEADGGQGSFTLRCWLPWVEGEQ
jgi:signal transduction histidine kinase